MSPTKYLKVYLFLIALLGLSLGLTYTDMGRYSTSVALGIASVKGTLIALYFMDLRHDKPIIRVFAGAGLAWLLILFTLTLSDYLSRGWTELPGTWP